MPDGIAHVSGPGFQCLSEIVIAPVSADPSLSTDGDDETDFRGSLAQLALRIYGCHEVFRQDAYFGWGGTDFNRSIHDGKSVYSALKKSARNRLRSKSTSSPRSLRPR